MSSAAPATGQRKPAHVCILIGLKGHLDEINKLLNDPVHDLERTMRTPDRLLAHVAGIYAFLTILRTMTIPTAALRVVTAGLDALRAHPALPALRQFYEDAPPAITLQETFDTASQEIRELGEES